MTLTGQFGIVPGAYSEGGQTDGVLFSAVTVDGRGREVILFERFLNPVGVPEDRGLQGLKVTWRSETSTELVLRTHPGPAGNVAWDWSFWTEISIATTRSEEGKE
jgi:hypothetical protein